MSRQFKPSSVLEKHAQQFYEGVPVNLYHNALPFHRPRPQFARFWFRSLTPYRAWVVAWDCKGVPPNVWLVDMSRMSISYYPQDPPPMPEWTHDTRKLARFWAVFRARTNHRGNHRGQR